MPDPVAGQLPSAQRQIECLDALDDDKRHRPEGCASKAKVAGIVITGSEDGALSVMGSIMMVLSFMGFTMPPGEPLTGVGGVGQLTLLQDQV